jgi:hypothetical protein
VNELETVSSSGAAAASEELRARRILRIVFMLFCLELGLILLLLPWTLLWDNNYFFSLVPRWSGFLMSSYVRGAVSGLGIINLALAVSEALRLRR